MELIRGKTFIKNYGHNPPGNLPSVDISEKKNISIERKMSSCANKHNSTSTQMISKGQCTNIPDNNYWCNKFVRKSKTHDCVTRENSAEHISSLNGKDRLRNSVSYSEFENASGKISHSTNNQQIIDYRHFVPQMPFVPSVAKTLPRKRISLKRSKKGFKNIFLLKKNKHQDMLSVEDKNRFQEIFIHKEEGKATEAKETFTDELSSYEFSDNELYIDNIDSCHSFCDDVASLKSFDSFTGCGEIFADESTTFMGMESRKDGHKIKFITKGIPSAGSYEGGVEKLASPAKSQPIDFSRLSGHINKSTRTSTSDTAILKEPSHDVLNDNVLESPANDMISLRENVTEAGSPVSTSDEGYYESSSPDEKKQPEPLRTFPRDSYSRDALYELFYDSSEIKPTSNLDCELSEHDNDNPWSMYSFCVGSEENMATPSASDLAGEYDLQSSWKGRECFMKLCDTELSLTIGMVNWLRKSGNIFESQVTSANSSITEQCKHDVSCEKEKIEDISNSVGHRDQQGNFKNNISSQKQLTNCVFNCKQSQDNYSKCLHGDVFSNQETEESMIYTPESNLSLLAKSSDSLSSDTFLNQLSLLLKTLMNNNTNTKNDVETFTLYYNQLHNLNLQKKSTEFQSKVDSQNTLHLLDLECIGPTVNEADHNFNKILEKCASKVSSMYITNRDQIKQQENNISLENVILPHTISINIPNFIEHQKYFLQQRICPALSQKSEMEENNTRLESAQMSLVNDTCQLTNSTETVRSSNLNKGYPFTEFVTPLFPNRSRIVPYFRSSCSSLISSYSSTLCKMPNSGETLIYLKAPSKYSEPLSNTDELTRNTNETCNLHSSVEISKSTEIDLLTPANSGEELLVTDKICSM